MGKRESYEPGTLCWVDLQTTDPVGAKAFYGDLFGWEAESMPVEGGVYTKLTLDGDEVAALNELSSEEREQGIPSYWLSYISIENADETAAKARELGGTIFGVFDVNDAGRMALIYHPASAYFAAWQPREHIGASRVNDPGCFNLSQLNTTDPERAIEFHKELFGWEITSQSEEPPYWGIHNKGYLNGGMMPSPDGNPYWLVYFTTEDLDDAVIKVDKLGGTTILPQTNVPPDGRIAVFTDPQGAIFALFEGRTDE